MNGILVVDKPAGFTSFDVVAKLRGICGTKKIGHGGTLDPMATGVLPVFVGPAAKAVDLAEDQSKAYLAQLLLGIGTDTGDITGNVTKRVDGVAVAQADLAALLPRFTGPQMQTPPMVSAVKVDGKPLYHYARKGIEVARKSRPITIHTLEVLADDEAQNAGLTPMVEDAAPYAGLPRFGLQVACSKGTYIRTLVEELGAALGLPATLWALRRSRSGAFGLDQAHSLPAIQQAKDEGRLEALLLPVDTLFTALPKVPVDDAGARRLQNGAPVYRVAGQPGRCRIYHNGQFLGLGSRGEDGTLAVEKLFI